MPHADLKTIGQALVLIAVMLAAIAAAAWLRPAPPESQACGGVWAAGSGVDSEPAGLGLRDPGEQRIAILHELIALNRRIDAIEKGLRAGTFSIRVIEEADGAAPAAEGER